MSCQLTGEIETHFVVEALMDMGHIAGVFTDDRINIIIAVTQQQSPALAGAVDVIFTVDVPDTDAFTVIENRAAAGAAAEGEVSGTFFEFTVGHTVNFFQHFIHFFDSFHLRIYYWMHLHNITHKMIVSSKNVIYF